MASTRERILAATNELFRRQGYNATSLKMVATASKAPIGSIYHSFPGGKEELGVAVITESGASYLQLFELIAAGAGDAPTAITDFFDGAAAVLEETDFIDICPIGTVARELASTNDVLRRASHAVFDTWIDAAMSLFVRAGLEVDAARSLASTLVSALEGGFILARASRDAGPLRATGKDIRHLVEARLEAAAVLAIR